MHPTRREYPDAQDFDDGNWVYATVEIAAGGLQGLVRGHAARGGLRPLPRSGVRPLYEQLSGRAVFDTMEEWLRIEIKGDGRGHFHAACEAVDRPGIGNRLTFKIDFDQTELPAVVRGLDAICDALPVVAAPRVSR